MNMGQRIAAKRSAGSWFFGNETKSAPQPASTVEPWL
jgi:hypothetical protein